eukprot:2196539-Amphidinium_carterae.1
MLLSYAWLVVTLFGPCLPVLCALLAMFATIYSVLLFGGLHLLDKKSRWGDAGMEGFGFSVVAGLALVLQSCNLPYD